MENLTFNFSTNDGLTLLGRIWQTPSPKPKGVVNLVHGLGEHSGRYADVAKMMNQAGYHFAGFDLRGHGLSEGKRGHSPGFDYLLDDVSIFLDQSRLIIGDPCPQFLYGHSLGGCIVINYGLRRSPTLAGVIATAPPLRLSFAPPKIKLSFGKIMSALFPSLVMRNELEQEALSRDKAIVKAYQDDVLVHDRISARLAIDLIEGGQYGLDHAGDWGIPLLLMHGTGDRISASDASEEFAQKAGEKVFLELWEDYYHEIHNDLGQEKVLQKMIDWLDVQTRQV